MKKVLLLLAGLLLTVSIFAQKALPSTQIQNANGTKVAFNSIVKPGRVTIISFWATWCVPCKKEIEAINSNLAKWKAEADFDYVIVSIDDSRALGSAKNYVKTKGYTFPSFYDPNEDLKRSLGFQNVPYTIIIDKTGKNVYQHVGYEKGAENNLFSKVKQLVK